MMDMSGLSGYKPPWWLRNCHIQSCIGSVFRHKFQDSIVWEQLDLPDGDFIDLCWAGQLGQPIVVLLHGLEGSADSHYIQLMMDVLTREGYHVVVMHFRSCSGRLNRIARSYHASETKDFEYLLSVLTQRYPAQPINVVGFSLGGNVLLHHLANCADSPVRSAVAISVPFELKKSADCMPGLYKWTLLRTMKSKSIQKLQLGQAIPATAEQIKRVSSFRSFDNLLTAPLNGFEDADDYYAQSSVRPLLKQIVHPALVIHAKDDPLIPPNSIPHQIELSKSTTFDLHDCGGHVGFLHGRTPWRLNRWFQTRILDFLQKSV